MSYYMGDIVRLRGKFFDAYNDGRYTDAIKYGNDIIQLYEDNNDTLNLGFANDLNNTSIVYGDLMANEKSIKLYRRAAEIKNKLLGENSLSYADTAGNLAVALSLEGKHNEALAIHKKVLKIRESLLDSTHKDCIMAIFNLGSAYEDLGKYDKAVSCFEAALKRADRQKAVLKKDYADILCGYARSLSKKGNYKKAVSNFCKATEILKTEEGESSFYYLSTLLEAAGVCEKAKFYDQAIVYYKRAIESRKKLLKKTHLDYITSLNSLAQAFIKKGDFDRAIETHKEVLSILKKLVGEEHQFYAECMNNLGIDYFKKGDYSSAMSFFEDTLNIKEKVFGRNNISYTVTLEYIGHVYREEKNFEEAFEKYNEAKLIKKQISGESNILYIDSFINLGRLFVSIEKYEKAKEYFEEGMRLRKGLIDMRDMSMAVNLQELANVSFTLGDYEKAINLMEEAANIRKSVFGRNHPKYARGLYYQGAMELKCKKLENALSSLESALDIQQSTLGENNSDYKDTSVELIKARSELCQHYFETGFYEDAVEQFEKGLELFEVKCLKGRSQYILKNLYYYTKGGNIKRAEALLEEILDFTEITFGKNCVEYADCMKVQGMIELSKGNISEGEVLFTKTVELEYMLLDGKSPSLNEICVLMGEAYFLKGDINKALSYYSQIKDKDEYFYRVQSGMGVCLLENKEYDKAYDYLQDALEYMESNNKIQNMYYVLVTKCLYTIDEKCKNYEKAAERLGKNISSRRKMKLLDEQDFYEDLIKLGMINKKVGKKDEASENFSEAASILNKKEGDTKKFADLIIKAAKINIERKRYEVSEVLIKKAAEIYGRVYGIYSDEYGNIIYDLSKLYLKTKENEKADSCFEIISKIVENNEESKFNAEKYLKYWDNKSE